MERVWVLIDMKKLLIIVIVLLLQTTAFAGWQEDLEAQFDVVETFDNLQDWPLSSGVIPSRGRNTSSDNMPKKIDNSASQWDMFDWWPTVSPNSDWIKNHGSNYVWRGVGKSLIMDMNQNTDVNKGPSRFGNYFGTLVSDGVSGASSSGIETSGYRSDVYLFQMVKFATNAFPKDDGDNLYYSYWKWGTVSTGNTAANVCIEGRDDCTYGASNAHFMLFNGTSTASQNLYKLEYYSDADSDGVAVWNALNLPTDGFQMWKPTYTERSIDYYIDRDSWFGLEIHVHRGTAGVADGYQEYWLYDADGTAHYVGRVQEDYMMVPAERDWGFNYFFQGGNISFQNLVEEQNLDVSYFVDDIILDDNRIGPAYFTMMASGTVPTCSDGIQNGDETGVDCGGSCSACGGATVHMRISVGTMPVGNSGVTPISVQ